LPEIFLEKYDSKSKEQNARKIGESLILKDWSLVYLAWKNRNTLKE